MRKFCFVVLAMLVASVCFAGQVQNEVIDETLSAAENYKDVNIDIRGAEKVTFFTTFAQNDTTKGVTASVTAAISADGSNWTSIPWMDTAGGVTPQTSEIFSSNGAYAGWIDNRISAKYLKIAVRMTNYAAYPYVDQTSDMTVTVVQDK